MKKMKKRTVLRRFGPCLLTLSLVLSGCTGGQNTTGGTDSSAVPTPSPTADQALDFTKYNAYLDVLDSVYEMDALLTAYFTVVQDQPEFALVEGMDYSMLDEDFSFYTFSSYPMEKAMGYRDEEPDYPEQDALLTALEEPFLAMGEILDDLGWYISYSEYEEDGMAKAAQLHTQLYEVVRDFDEAAFPFMDSMDVLDQSTEQQELDRLKSEGMDIAYYSRIIVNLSYDIDDEIWTQLAQADTEGLPTLDMTNLETLYQQHQEAYAELTKALADPEQVKTIWPDDSSSESQAELYGTAVEDVNTALDNFMQAARSQADYSSSYESYTYQVSFLVDLYNSVISG